MFPRFDSLLVDVGPKLHVDVRPPNIPWVPRVDSLHLAEDKPIASGPRAEGMTFVYLAQALIERPPFLVEVVGPRIPPALTVIGPAKKL